MLLKGSPFVDQTKVEDFHELLRVYADIFTKNVHATRDCTYKHLKTLTENKDLVVLSGDKDSCLVILKRSDYDRKLQSMIDEEITNGTYAPTTDWTLTDFKKFQDFCVVISKTNLLIIKIWDSFLINLVGYTLLQKLISSIH